MKLGVCCEPKHAALVAGCGFSFAEFPVSMSLMPDRDEREFEDCLGTIQATGIEFSTANCFIPARFKITDPAADSVALRSHVEMTMARAERAGLKLIVFGSGAARSFSDSVGREVGMERIGRFCAMAADLAQQHGVTIALEPLNRRETNVVNTVGEGADLVRQIDHPNFRLLVDAFHFLVENDSYDDLIAHRDLLVHTHIATFPNRLQPGAEPCDFRPFFETLSRIGYSGYLATEGKLDNLEGELPRAFGILEGEYKATLGTAH